MSSVSLVTFCHSRDVDRLHSPGVLQALYDSHGHPFDEVLVIHQNVDFQGYPEFDASFPVRSVAIDLEEVVARYVALPDESAETLSGGPSTPHYWKYHCANHWSGLEEASSDYIVFADSDTLVIQGEGSWVAPGISILERFPQALLVVPHWGGADGIHFETPEAWFCRTVSQQLFLIERPRMLGVDWSVPWNWEKLAPGGPFREFYGMLEGRLWRYMDKYDLYRVALKGWRYWHSASFSDPAPPELVTRR